MRFHCLFEQSGTFRDVFQSYGHESWCYDIQNEYGKTDFQIDLFKEIENEFENITNGWGYKTVFSDMKLETDFIMAFFPCTYFTGMQQLNFKLLNYGAVNNKNNRRHQKAILGVLEKTDARAYFFKVWIKFCYVCETLGIKTIIENPAGWCSYVALFSPYFVSFYEKDRSLFGDKFKKPTNFFAINFEMKERFRMFDVELKTMTIMNQGRKCASKQRKNVVRETKLRSEITSRYADNFYKRFIEHSINGEQISAAPLQQVQQEQKDDLFALLDYSSNN